MEKEQNSDNFYLQSGAYKSETHALHRYSNLTVLETTGLNRCSEGW